MSDQVNYHDYLKKEDYYESRNIGKGRRAKTCEHCGGNIPVGEAHTMHHFYPDFEAAPTHNRCNDAFLASLLPNDEPEDYNDTHLSEFEKGKVNEFLEHDMICHQMLNFIRSTGNTDSAINHLTGSHGMRKVVAEDYINALCKIHDIDLFKLP